MCKHTCDFNFGRIAHLSVSGGNPGFHWLRESHVGSPCVTSGSDFWRSDLCWRQLQHRPRRKGLRHRRPTCDLAHRRDKKFKNLINFKFLIWHVTCRCRGHGLAKGHWAAVGQVWRPIYLGRFSAIAPTFL